MVAAPLLLIPRSLEEWLDHPQSRTEWVDGELVQKEGMTLEHSKLQRRLSTRWHNYQEANSLGGEVYTDVPCRTHKQGRSPDVAYLTPELVAEYGQEKVLPQSFPLSAEIVSPTDLAEDVILKAQEYLASGGVEVWLVYPESQWIIVVTTQGQQIFVGGQTVSTQTVLSGFSIGVSDLLA